MKPGGNLWVLLRQLVALVKDIRCMMGTSSTSHLLAELDTHRLCYYVHRSKFHKPPLNHPLALSIQPSINLTLTDGGIMPHALRFSGAFTFVEARSCSQLNRHQRTLRCCTSHPPLTQADHLQISKKQGGRERKTCRRHLPFDLD